MKRNKYADATKTVLDLQWKVGELHAADCLGTRQATSVSCFRGDNYVIISGKPLHEDHYFQIVATPQNSPLC